MANSVDLQQWLDELSNLLKGSDAVIAPAQLARVESREAIMPRPSLLDLDMRLSVHPAPDVLSFRFCSCDGVWGNSGEQLEDCFSSSCYDFHLRGVVVLSRHWSTLIHSIRMYGFAVSRQKRFHLHRVCCYVHSSRLSLHQMGIYLLWRWHVCFRSREPMETLYGLVLATDAVGKGTTVSLAVNIKVNPLLTQQSEKRKCGHEGFPSTKIQFGWYSLRCQ